MAAGLTWALLGGATAGLGVVLIARELLPSQPQLAAALERLQPPKFTPTTAAAVEAEGAQAAGTSALETRVGQRLLRPLQDAPLVHLPERELNLLGRPITQHLGQKVLMGLLGLVFPTVFTVVTAAVGVTLPIVVPALGGLVLGAVLFVVPDLEVHRKAAGAREEFARAVSAYIDLTALERTAGVGPHQALEQAATIGDSWVFVRLREELTRAELAGVTPWEALHGLDEELGLPELSDVADIMRICGENDTAVADTLRARSRGLRVALLSKEQTRANEQSERMVMPVAMLGLIFFALLGAPAIIRIL